MDDMNVSESWTLDFRYHEQHEVVDDKNDFHS